MNIDPNLTGGSMVGVGAARNKIVVSISVEELRELIFESVKRAVAEKTDKENVVGEEPGAVVSREEEGGLV